MGPFSRGHGDSRQMEPGFLLGLFGKNVHWSAFSQALMALLKLMTSGATSPAKSSSRARAETHALLLASNRQRRDLNRVVSVSNFSARLAG